MFRVRQHETDTAAIEGWLADCDTVRAFLVHFYSLPPHIRNAFFRRPQPASSSPSPPTTASAPSPSSGAATPPPHGQQQHAGLTLPFIALSSAPSVSAAATADAPIVPPPPFPAGLSSYSSPWLEWLRSTRPVSLTIHCLESLHSLTHTPWWLTLILAGLITRTALLPFVLYQAHLLHSIRRLQPHFAYIRQLLAASSLPYPRKVYEAGRMRWALYWKYSCHPLKLLVPGLLQLSALVLVAVSMRPLLFLSPDLQTGGAWWVPDLSAYDPLFILPIAVTALQYAFLHYTEHLAKRNAAPPGTPPAPSAPAPTVSALTASTGNSLAVRLAELFSYYRGALTILLLPVVATLPAGLFVFQLTTLAYQMVQTAVMARPGVKRWLGLDREVRALGKRREESTEEEVREFERLRGEIERKLQVKRGQGVVAGRSAATVDAPVTMFVKPTGGKQVKAGHAKKARAA